MYVCISCLNGVRAGDIVILERDSEFNDIAAKILGGITVGFVTDKQPEGCVSKEFVQSRIGQRRVIGKAAILSGNVMLFATDSDLMSENVNMYTEKRGYGMFIR